MPLFPDNWAIESAFPATAESPARSCELEEQVITLFDQLRDRLLRYVMSLGIPAHDGEEIVQEVFLSLFQHLQAGRPRHHLRGWVFRVAHNLALKQRCARQRLGETVESEASIIEQQLDPRPNPEELVACTQRQQRLLAVVHALSEQDQRCLRLRAEGLRYREIAGVLGISLGAVSISLTRSLARLGRVDER
ncbi:MAG: RNA polymerase sigma factor [Terriglobia bacterium]